MEGELAPRALTRSEDAAREGESEHEKAAPNLQRGAGFGEPAPVQRGVRDEGRQPALESRSLDEEELLPAEGSRRAGEDRNERGPRGDARARRERCPAPRRHAAKQHEGRREQQSPARTHQGGRGEEDHEPRAGERRRRLAIEKRAQRRGQEQGDREVQAFLKARGQQEEQRPERDQAEGGQHSSAARRNASGEDQERRRHHHELEDGNGPRMPAHEAPERSVKHRKEGAVGAEVKERCAGGPLVDREVAAVEARHREGPRLEPVVDGVVEDARDVIEERAPEEDREQSADLDGRKRGQPDGPGLVPHGG